MSATAVETADISAPAAVRQPAWKLLNSSNALGSPTWAAAREAAGLTWEPTVARIPLADEHGMPILTGMNEDGTPVYAYEDSHKRMTRGPGGSTLGYVNDSYGVISHAAIGALVDPLLDVPGTSFEHLVELNGGKEIFALIRIGEQRAFGSDFSPTVPYLAMKTSHDGSGSLKMWGTTMRLSCTNMAQASEAVARTKGMSVTLRHTNRWEFNAHRVESFVHMARGHVEQVEHVSRELSAIKISPKQREAYVRAYFPMPPTGQRTDRAIKAVERNRDALRVLLESETNAPIADTALGLAQAAVEWADHGRASRSADALLIRNVIRPQNEKIKAWKLARNVMGLQLAA